MEYKFLRTTKNWKKYWRKRTPAKQDPEHPHRDVIVKALKRFEFKAILEVGCGAGANLYKIKQAFPHSDIGGIDWNPKAIEEARKILPRASVLQEGEACDIYISSKGSDIILSDMCFIYLNHKEFIKAIREAKRVARNGVLFCELHSESILRRWWERIYSGYFMHDYRKTLEKEGFYDIKFHKLTQEEWPGDNPQKTYGYIITAKP